MSTIPARTATTDLVTSWTSADGHGEMSALDIDGKPSVASDVLREFLAVCANDAEREGILAGRFVVAEAGE